jgi:O-antigen biosynthesis protein WbqV
MSRFRLFRNFAHSTRRAFAAALPRNLLRRRNIAVFTHDVAMAYVAFVGAFYLRIGPRMVEAEPRVFKMAAAFAAVAALVYLFTGLYRHVWEYVSARDAFNVVRTAALVVLLFLPAWFFVTRLEGLPRSLPVISAILLATLLGGPRLAVRVIRDNPLQGRTRGTPGTSTVLLVGAGPEAEQFVRAVARDPSSPFTVVGMVTKNPSRVGQVIQGVEVLGMDGELPEVLADLEARDLKADKVVLVRRDIAGAEVRRLLAVAEAAGCQLARVPPPTVRAYDSRDGDLKPRPIAIEDLLGRPQQALDRAAMTAMLAGRRVLVTGAGGSIGAELVRQISDAAPAALTLVENSEYALYRIDQEMRGRPGLKVAPLLADVRDPARLAEAFAATRPEVVFHAAAFKHVPLVEANPLEGLLTNAVGTRNVADACVAAGVGAMVLISTDKAVNPANVMGASKRLAEIYCQALDLRQNGTRFVTVRFGNVLGSAGSVVPLFQRQLEAGGPLTVTHPEIERYFMTVREAVELVLQAAALGLAGEDRGAIHVLDMGQPVKIVDLARQMIRLAGKVPDVDVRIAFIGLRPGEKLSEELFHGEEPPAPTPMAGVLLAHPRAVDHGIIAGKLTALAEACRRRDETAALALVRDLVPELNRAQPGGGPNLRLVR